MLKKIKVLVLFVFAVQLHSQSLVNDGASIMLQTGAVVYSEDTFLNRNNGAIYGNGTMDFSSAQNIGTINPGVVIGDLTFNSRLTNTSSAGFMFDIQGTAGIGLENGHDHVFVDGDLVLDGVLDITTLDGFMPATTDSFTLITYTGNISGEFSSVSLGANLAGFAVEYSMPGQIRLVHESILSTDETSLQSLQVFPNPTNDLIYIRSLDKIDKVEVYSLIGKLVLSTNKTDAVDLGNFAKGLYLVKVYSENKFSVKKIQVQ
jgi:hypothetical protein